MVNFSNILANNIIWQLSDGLITSFKAKGRSQFHDYYSCQGVDPKSKGFDKFPQKNVPFTKVKN